MHVWILNNHLLAALPIVKGYKDAFKLDDEELKVLYVTVAIRLVISVTKSAINKKKEPDNKYLQISEKPAWELLQKVEKYKSEFCLLFFQVGLWFRTMSAKCFV